MTLNNLVGNECPTEIAKLINAIIAQKATNSLDNLDDAGQKKFTDLANSISNVNDLVTALSALVDTKLSAEALLEQNGYIKFSNGLLLQWGAGRSLGSAKNRQILPLSYSPTTVIGTTWDTEDGHVQTIAISNYEKGAFLYTVGTEGTIYNNTGFSYIAVCII